QASIADATSYFNQFAVTNFSVTYLLDGNVVGSGNLEILGAGAVPEPATWAMMILGFGAVGSLVRRRRHGLAAA
ncbi:MAG TPA: PEPxxWA-CTERM sorting domain-containing protein, partial [Candidatus Paceibacterota bacterium]|nr:PEPxxWA-CTERM sorting domain-containing protein [Candidatus Paceibacterota bacterium]